MPNAGSSSKYGDEYGMRACRIHHAHRSHAARDARYLHVNLLAPQKGTGFSMVELMTVLAVAAILLGLAIPSFAELIQNQKASATVNDFLSAIQLTRSEAIRRGVRVDLVPVSDTWATGWTIFIDEDGDQKAGAGEQIIYTHAPVPPGMSVSSALTDQSPLYLAYTGTGRSRTNLADGQQPQYGSFTFELGNQRRKIVLNALGRPRVCSLKPGEASC